MQKLNLNNLPEELSSGRMTMDECISFLWEEIYRKPLLFGLSGFDQDQVSDFLIYVNPRLKDILSKYDSRKMKFFFYLKQSLFLLKTCWIRKIQREGMVNILNRQYAENTLKSQMESSGEAIKLDSEKQRNIAISNPQRSLEIARITALILLYKNCNEIDDEILRNVARFSQKDEKILHEKIQKLRAITSRRKELREKIIFRRDNAFFFHRKYETYLSKIEPGTESYLQLLKMYYKKTKCWIRQNELLASRFKTVPPNRIIAHELSISERKIFAYLKNAMNEKSSFRKHAENFFNSLPEKENDD